MLYNYCTLLCELHAHVQLFLPMTCMQRPEMSIGVFLLFSDRVADQQALGICIPLSHNNRAVGMGDKAHAWLFYTSPRYLNSISLV